MTESGPFGAEKRQFPRWLIGEQGIVAAHGASSACVAVDISAGGVMVKTHARVRVEEEIELMLTGVLPLTARVVRVEPGHVAAHFTAGPQYLFR